MLQVKTFIFGPFSENTYLLYDTDTREAAVIDPGNAEPNEDKMLFTFIAENSLILKFIIATHSHIDHLLGVSSLKEKYSAQFLAPEQDMPLLQNMKQQADMFGLDVKLSPDPDAYLTEKKEIKLGDFPVKFIFTPGHTPGEYCLYIPSQKLLFSGDVLFRDSIGRTDLWGGDYKTLLNSIHSRLMTLPEDITVYPGHGGETTIGYEKEHNPFLN